MRIVPPDDDGVSTGSGSDRVSINAVVDIAGTVTPSLPLPVVTYLILNVSSGSRDFQGPTSFDTNTNLCGGKAGPVRT